MGWFSSSSSTNTALPSHQVEQRSHEAINLAPNSDIATTLNQLSSQTDSDVKVKELAGTQDKQTIETTVEKFVESYPQTNVFVIDGERDSKDSIICTNNSDGGKTCLKLKYNSIELFKTMQKKEYFCSLPDDIDATYFECRKIQ
ncbi:hypothetical protein SBY92_003667 [Candida maltosa Xu316]|uniref:Uncharacterized protein n=1 Tax=Candida maltosa (strain Xu316) TaxID=1245528 RepID=M3IUB6_CANMX|nr:hypothetical protein G210_4774 [Candida maltosa Xu316]